MSDKPAEPNGRDVDATVPVEHEMGELAATGIAGLDDILNGGLVRNRLYLIEGFPGSGKAATVQALVCMRPWVSVAGTRCTR